MKTENGAPEEASRPKPSLLKRPSNVTMSGAMFGGMAGAFIGGPVGAVVGIVLGGVAGEAIERYFPSEHSSVSV